MEIRQFRVVLRARDFERTCRFYGEVLGFPRLQSWDREENRGALYQAGSAAVEIRGRAHGGGDARDEAFDYQGPDQKLTLSIVVASVERAYEEASFRDPNLPGGLHQERDGTSVFLTHDPDGVRIVFRQTDA